ncbi:MAG: endopeptidase La [Bacteroidaceae bacterium]|nr:endopeptidase La [Bacteroidaceae bacterium]MBQ5912964.1 endopeptidase La [Bacteroidaceae bacterium]
MRKNPSFSFVTEIDADVEKVIRDSQDGEMGILALRDNILFPGTVTPITIGRKKSLKTLKKAEKSGSLVAAFAQKNVETEEPTMDDLYHVGSVCRVVHLMKLPDGNHSALIQAMNRVGLDEMHDTPDGLMGKVTAIPDIKKEEDMNEQFMTYEMTLNCLKQLATTTDDIPMELMELIKKMPLGVFFANFLCTNFPFSVEKKAQLICEDTDLGRATLLLKFFKFELKLAKMRQNIEAKTHADLNRQQREYFVNQEIRNLQAELGNTDEFSNKFEDLNLLRAQGKTKKWSPSVAELFEKEIMKLSRINAQSPDYNVQLNYLQTMLQLPWGEYTQDNLDLKRAQRFLDEDHYGMEKVKERIMEHLAVLKLKADKKSPIICLYGPPGVGKTSLCKSIANALKRNYVRISLGGMHDESEIRGHRRTYIGAMPGRIIKSIIKAGSSNPVFVLDEIDKVTQATTHGDPSSALLEVLDPEQNTAFHDNFLDVDYDLSNVMFIATANNIHTIPRPLLDRMELIEVGGYITEEKIEIVRRHLFPKEKENNGLENQKGLKIKKNAIEKIIEQYTRESGVRSLEKQINKMLRKVALEVAKEQNDGIIKNFVVEKNIDDKEVERLLGKPLFSRDSYQGNGFAGVVTGLAWTSVGGEILFIETSISEGKGGRLTLTGNLGDVMKESATIALEWIRCHVRDLGIDPRVFENYNIHIHVPEGAVPKDGPSAGITMATSLASALTQRKVRKEIAMTGEITLRGKVLPVGGIREKILAAKRAGIKHIVLCQDNKKDIDEIPEVYLNGVTFHYVNTVMDVLDYALLSEKVANPIEFHFEEKNTKEDSK